MTARKGAESFGSSFERMSMDQISIAASAVADSPIWLSF